MISNSLRKFFPFIYQYTMKIFIICIGIDRFLHNKDIVNQDLCVNDCL
jgi:hypothetical protein